MTATFRFLLFFSGFSLLAKPVLAQEMHMLSGYVRDSASGERLNQAQIRVESSNGSASIQTNNYGFYSLRLAAGSYSLRASASGHSVRELSLNLSADLSLNLDLAPRSEAMQEINITTCFT